MLLETGQPFEEVDITGDPQLEAAYQALGDAAIKDKVIDFTILFSIPMWIALACLLALLMFYPGRKKSKTHWRNCFRTRACAAWIRTR